MNEVVELLRSFVSIVVYWYEHVSATSWWPFATWAAGGTVSVATLMRSWAAVKQYHLKKAAAETARVQDEDLRLHWFLAHDFVTAAKDYIVPHCSNVDPSNREDLRNTVAVREPVFAALDRQLDADDKRHILILADSGMGKTTLLLNLA